MPKKVAKKKRKLSDTLARRTRKDDPQSRTGIGGRRRQNRIDEYVDSTQTGKRKKKK